MEYTIQLTFYLLHTVEPMQLGKNDTEVTPLHTARGGEEEEARESNLKVTQSSDFANTCFNEEPSAGPALHRCCVGRQSCTD